MAAIEELLAEAQQYAIEDPGMADELLQHLMELAYLPEMTVPERETIRQAIVQFEKEVHSSSLFSMTHIQRQEELFGSDWHVQVLRVLVDLDDGVLLKNLPENGEVSLSSRLIHYRLHLFGLLESAVSSDFNGLTTQGLSKLQDYGRFATSLDAINALADIGSFTQRLLHVWGRENMLVVFQIPEKSGEPARITERFLRRFRKDFNASPDFSQRIHRYILDCTEAAADYQYLMSRALTDLNAFLVRLIQVHQWADGMYTGQLDNELGGRTFESIQTLIALFNADEDTEEVAFYELVAHIGRGYYMLNAYFLLNHYMATDVTTSSLEGQNLLEALKTASSEQQQVFHENTELLLQQARSGLQSDIARKGVFKRVYCGVGRLFKSIFRWGQKLFKWIVRKMEKILNFLKEFFSRLLRVAGKALQMFIDGILFLLGKKPFISTSGEETFQITQIRLDGDACSLMDVRGAADAQSHSAMILKNIHTMGFCLEIVEQVFHLLKYLAGIAITWPLILIQLARAYKELTEKYQLLTIV